MNIFMFSSKNLTNIWAGIGARLWAVSDTGIPATRKGRVTKSKSMRVRSFGILYCSETHALTTPFVVYSAPDQMRVVTDVWPEEWVLPFRILQLGDPSRQLRRSQAKRVIPSLKEARKNFDSLFHVQATTAFAPSKIGEDDWEVLIQHLASEAVESQHEL